MAKLLDSKCCDSCWHGAEKPCPELIDCIQDGPNCHDSSDCANKLGDRLAELRREKLTKPAIFVGAGTCGLGAGAGKTLKKLRAWLENKNIDADVVEVG
ncbi:MAG: CCxxC motif-containing NuoF prefix domain-containing protein, partial [Planctomycetota bacterium]